MSLFDRFKKKESSKWQERTEEELRRLFQKEGIACDDNQIQKLCLKFPQMRLFSCGGRCPAVMWIGDSAPVHCPTCNKPLKLIPIDADIPIIPESVANPLLAQIHFQNAFKFFEQKQFDQAIHLLNRAIQLKPDFIDAYYNRSEVRAMMNDPDGVIDDCNCVLRLNPEDRDAFFNRGNAKLKKEDPIGGFEDISKAMALGYSKPNAFFYRAICLIKMDKGEEAIPDLKKFISLAPEDPMAETAKMLMVEEGAHIEEDAHYSISDD